MARREWAWAAVICAITVAAVLIIWRLATTTDWLVRY